ncbi:succinyl-diaminopimelate desuccinylase [Larsenimonas rhizosphaerae]|uniref:Succinyl-diaminopimelate desuccinylase n=1 Tax=Larsenimonas rhizosphaerae TaxID=2944682 RepID=A0AA42CXV5_9GAMM|nr:succinyl-diaminopimelate desuccinylase [Larsenimonas rhizosphaerae]MCM2129657.1 succinyl-diaminopimelate desuccinylase [Larsenimonas rhizosphaerae]MCX2524315.1 succinyl-diaminopimelate desuccinylase [Larsenimonas rhizosphaerae]
MPDTLSDTLQLACDLLARPSVTPDDAGCQALIAERLEALGFHIEAMNTHGVTNLWATRGTGPTLVLAGHTDVVPTGPEQSWQQPPFTPLIDEQGYLRARGASDMKGSLAAMVTAVERFIAEQPDHPGRLAFLITSDEEGPAIHGTRAVVETLAERGERPEYCIVGEPSSTSRLGDVVKNGRRGSLGATLRVFGQQGHVAYPHMVDNPIHLAAPALDALAREQWDEGNTFFPATSFQISNIHAGTGATNMVPGTLDVVFNFRFSTEVTAEQLKERTCALLDRFGFEYSLDWTLFGEPFLTPAGALLDSVVDGVRAVTGEAPQLLTSGGTSDGRFIATLGTQVIELGPCNDTIHQIDERVRATDLDTLSDCYQAIFQRLLGH